MIDEGLEGRLREIEARAEAATKTTAYDVGPFALIYDDVPWLIAQLRAAERRVVREGEMRVLAADALEAGDDVARVAAYLRYISSEEVTAEDLEWARNVVERQDAATLASTQPATQDGPAEEAQ